MASWGGLMKNKKLYKAIVIILALLVFFISLAIPAVNISLSYETLTTLGNRECYNGYDALLNAIDNIYLFAWGGFLISTCMILLSNKFIR